MYPLKSSIISLEIFSPFLLTINHNNIYKVTINISTLNLTLLKP